jgi:cytochrome c-type biogenesis protein CcmF
MAHRLKWAFAVAVTGAILLPLTAGGLKPLTSISLGFVVWIIASAAVILADSLRGSDGRIALRRVRLLPASIWGMHLAHIGIAVFVFGVTMVKSYEIEQDGRMEIGQTIEIGGYQIRFDGLRDVRGPNYDATRGEFTVSRDGKTLTKLYPEKRVYRATRMPMTEAAIDHGLMRDVYLSMGEPLGDKVWAVRTHVKPFVKWIWFGCVLMAAGGVLAAADRRYRRPARVAASEAAAATTQSAA